MTARPARAGEAGFLLVEMLTTLTICAFVLAGLVTVGSVLLRAVDRSVAAVEATDDLGRTLTSLDATVRTAVRARLDGAEGQPFLFNGDDRRLMFAHRDTTPGRPPVTQVIALRSDNGRLLRAEATLPARVGALDELRFGPPRVVYAGDVRIRFAYSGAATRTEGEGAARTAWPVGSAMPAAVTVEAVDTATGRVKLRTRAAIAANADRGCLVDGMCGRADRPSSPLAAAGPEGAPPDVPAGAPP